MCVQLYSTQVEFEEKYASSILKQHWLSIGALHSVAAHGVPLPSTYLPLAMCGAYYP